MEQMKDKKNTIIYGGAFNPPTLAHQAILQACIDYAEKPSVDADVWLMPSGDRTDKRIENSYANRLEMLRALTHDVVRRNVRVDIETMEIDQQERTETYETVLALQDKYPDRNMIWVFGSDSVNTMPEWDRGDWLVENLEMLVVERPGYPLKVMGRKAVELQVESIRTSSTEVRDRIDADESIEHLVPPSVLAHLRA
jgi:nicotinate-nucleotide adenylyltransferase